MCRTPQSTQSEYAGILESDVWQGNKHSTHVTDDHLHHKFMVSSGDRRMGLESLIGWRPLAALHADSNGTLGRFVAGNGSMVTG